jgi:hypothetical protein
MTHRVLLAALASSLVAAGCNAVVDATGYHVQAEASASQHADAGAADASLTDAGTAPGVDACVPGTTRATFENACTTATCVAPTTSLPSCDGGLCPLPSSPPPMPDGGAGAASSDAGAMPCTAVNADPNSIIFVTGSTALKSFIQEVSQALATQPTNPVTIVYQGSGSCIGVAAAIDPTDTPMVPALGPTTYYDSAGNAETCSLDPNNPVIADIGASDVFYSTCYLDQAVTPPLPQSVAENYGPVQIMNFAVPEPSTQRSISLTQAYYVFGFGGTQYPVAPWTDPTELQIRSAASGTQAMIAAAIGVPASYWFGVSNASSSAVGSALIAAGQSSDSQTTESALGILASDYLKQNPQTLRGLAVADRNMACAYYPSTTATASDFANVRDGHYPLWGPSHFYTRVNAQTQLPVKPGASQFVDGLSGIVAVPGLDLVAEYASKGLVPECAMHVSRTTDGAEYSPELPTVTCNCYYDLIATGATTCQTCNVNSDCPSTTPNCNKFGPAPQQGYCDL